MWQFSLYSVFTCQSICRLFTQALPLWTNECFLSAVCCNNKHRLSLPVTVNPEKGKWCLLYTSGSPPAAFLSLYLSPFCSHFLHQTKTSFSECPSCILDSYHKSVLLIGKWSIKVWFYCMVILDQLTFLQIYRWMKTAWQFKVSACACVSRPWSWSWSKWCIWQPVCFLS